MTPAATLVSVCIANYNGESLLSSCLDSVLSQDCDGALEVIVHDDASSDDSVALLEEHYPGVQLIKSNENVGFCIANNRMVTQAKGDFILLLNNDAALLPGAIDALLSYARSHQASSVLTLPQFDWDTGELVDRGCLLDPFYNPIPNLDPSRTDVGYVIGACLWMPRQLWNQLGGFPEQFGSVAEDLYLCALARISGASVCALGVSGYRHRQGASFGGNRPTAGKLRPTINRRRLSERNKTLTLAILSPAPVFLALMPVHAVLLLLEGAVLSISNTSIKLFVDVYLAALTELWKRRDYVLASRTRVRRLRRISWSAYYKNFQLLPRKLTLLLRHGLPCLVSSGRSGSSQ